MESCAPVAGGCVGRTSERPSTGAPSATRLVRSGLLRANSLYGKLVNTSDTCTGVLLAALRNRD